MPDRDVVLAKVASIQRCLRRIREVTGLDPRSLEDINVQDIFVLNLQRAVQAAIDLAAHLVATERLGLPDAIRENFVLLAKGKIISPTLSKKMQAMVGFRNIAVHDYQDLDQEVLKAILTQHTPDIEEFYDAVLRRFRPAGRRKGGAR